MEEYLVQMKGISKFFPGVVALDKVDFELRAGEVHALLGENGAGKSTLMKIIGGIYQKDEGEVKIRGKTQEYSTVAQASELGIAVIHQELNMCRHLTVAENIFLGRELKKGGMVDFKEQNARASKLLKELSLNIEPDTEVGKLSVSKQQMVEIAKALSTNADIIIMDEPSSALTERETQELFRIINELKNMGKGIIYISHRLEELENIVDRVTVMRRKIYKDRRFQRFVYRRDNRPHGRARDNRKISARAARARQKNHGGQGYIIFRGSEYLVRSLFRRDTRLCRPCRRGAHGTCQGAVRRG